MTYTASQRISSSLTTLGEKAFLNCGVGMQAWERERQPRTLVELLRAQAMRLPEQVVYEFLGPEDEAGQSISYAELDRRARAIAARLQALEPDGGRALLLYDPGLDYIAAFFGCLYAGVVAVPCYPPRRNQRASRLQAIVDDARPALVLAQRAVADRLGPEYAQLFAGACQPCVLTDQLDDQLAERWQDPGSDGQALAFLQYTSGSTSTPKGVMLTHGNLLANLERIRQAFETSDSARGVFWLPLYHDMGLIGGVLETLYCGGSSTLMSPITFLRRPLRWLELIAQRGASISGAPNFAYDLCVTRSTPQERQGLDLSRWELAFNGAEPVQQATLERFAEAFAPYGFRRSAFYPCYGLAEATLMVSGADRRQAPCTLDVDAHALQLNQVRAPWTESGRRTLVSSGRPFDDHTVLIVDPRTTLALPSRQIGEIWVAGPSVAQGYWGRPQQSEAAFQARLAQQPERCFLRTGDLGFLSDGQLYITGRSKDLIIIRGRNHYPQDIEATVQQSHPALQPLGAAAFSVEREGQERLIVLCELQRGSKQAELPPIVDAIRQAIAEAHELAADDIVLVRSGSLPRTSSGKLQRYLCRQQYLAGQLEALGCSQAPAGNAQPGGAELAPALLDNLPNAGRRDLLEGYLRAQVAGMLNLAPATIDLQRPLTSLGLDSLQAIELHHRLQTALQTSIPMLALLEGGSLGSLVELLLAETSQPGLAQQALDVEAEQASRSLSAGQKALWFLQQLAPDSPAYTIASAVRISGPLDTAALGRALQRLVERHACLRTSFCFEDGEPRAVPQPVASFGYAIEDAIGWSQQRLSQRLLEEIHQPFDLERGPLLRVRLFRQAAHEHSCVLCLHHIIADLWSISLLMQELVPLYQAEIAGSTAALPALASSYAAHVARQRQLLSSPEGERLFEYWRSQLSAELPVLEIIPDRARPAIQTYRGATLNFALGPELSRQLKALAESQGMTLYTLLLAAYMILLHRLSGQQDLLVGSPTTGRVRAESANLLGYFVNPIVLRADFSGDPTLRALLGQVRQTVLEGLAHQEYPFATLVERLQIRRDSSRSPIFQAAFSLQKAHLDPQLSAFALGQPGARLDFGGLTMQPLALDQQIAQFDLSLLIAEHQGALAGSLQYNRDLYDYATSQRFMAYYQVLLMGLASMLDRPISRLPLLPPHEEQRLLSSWNSTLRDRAALPGLQSLFEAQVRRTPGATAVRFGDQQLCYEELNRRANQLAHHLRRRGVGPDVLVGICAERSLELVVGLLGVLKAGGAFLPLDPAYPQERLAYMIDDAGVAMLLIQSQLSERLPAQPPRCALDADWPLIAGESEADPDCLVSPEHSAYLVYTSGSLGRPKGTLVSQRSLLNLCAWYQDYCAIDEGSKVLLMISFSFDASFKNIIAPLLSGGELVLGSPGFYDPLALLELIARRGITLINATPSLIQPIIDLAAGNAYAELASLETLALGGEALELGKLRPWLRHSACRCRLLNIYGPTECCDISSAYAVPQPAIEHQQSAPIGLPIDNMSAYILDQRGNLQPIGVAGELCLSGVGLAHGYHNNPALTADKFRPHPFEAGQRIYRTGDHARRLPTGELEFLGRIDQQVKLRGLRIELGEIESVLRQHPSVKEPLVLLREDRGSSGLLDRRLVAYVTTRAAHEAEQRAMIGELRSLLQGKLPDYMLPAAFVLLERWPLTPNGKIDRAALPPPVAPPAQTAAEQPRSSVERAIAEIWRELLNTEAVGLHDNFFELGGHSLLVVQGYMRLRSLYSVDLQMTDMFRYPTIAALAEYLTQQTRTGIAGGEQPNLKAELSSGKQRLRQQLRQRLEIANKLGEGNE